ncbi:succinylglutamate-semialdehyde dehydrogenase [Sandaracinobacter sp. RS1-74]|uniref:succinylglutamate-semialdehyde dehydrogenase n=1 Tax=Sandaracinobacteroides sayramensis TaxID=2913411 RepID=UPI001ED9CD31|nr:succinylglutamate-semialdehyde dehydrogenase [Sandaracinobacteroides sayramensis]MCG2840718.1 succinylglutamate-semialdehyde dehydrogenase [Sandaracinobacteroides sayramensis]
MPPSDRLRSHRPHDGSLLWEGAAASAAQVVAAAARARAAQPGWFAAGLEKRVEVARAFKAAVEADADGFARLIAEETGKPFWEAKTEVASVAGKVEISIAAHAERTGSREAPFKADPAGASQALRHKPHGVLAVLGPYNFPAHLPNGHIVPALIAGNALLFKPSELTPAVGAHMAGLWAKAGLPDGVLELVQGAGETGRALAAADTDGLLFTGSAQTGAALARQFAETPHRILALEMGGNNPLVAWGLEAGDVEAAALVVVQSAFLSAGQRCTCARRLIVEDGAADALVDAVVALADRLRIGQPFADPQPFMGCVISNPAADGLLARSQAIHGKTIRPLIRQHEGLPFLTPGIADVTGLEVADEELFGPFLQLIRVRDFEAAIRAANATRFGLSAALLGGDRGLYQRFWAGSRAGVVNWNRPTNGAASNAPFGGVGLSGNHRPSAYYAADYCAWPVASVEAERPFVATPQGIA